MELKDSIHNFIEAAVMGLGSHSLTEFLTAFGSTNIQDEEYEDEPYRD